MKVASSSLFSQLLSIVDRSKFEGLVRKTQSERGAKGFASWDHLVAMLFCQLAQAKSLREIHSGLRSCEGKLKHLGLEQAPARSTLSYANSHRPSELFQSLFYQVLERVSHKAPQKSFRFKSKLLSLDSTVIELCSSMFNWAQFRSGKGAAKLHLLLDHDGYLPCFASITEGKTADVKIAQNLSLPKGSIIVMDRGYTDYPLYERWSAEGIGFVTRLKKNADWWNVEDRPVKESSDVRRDVVGEFNLIHAGRKIKGTYRCVTIWIEDKKEEMILLTNRLDLAAETIAKIYRERWQIELFFKAIKQHLRIKTFVGTSANAVKIQIWTALISMLLLKYLQFKSQIPWALSNLVALLRWNLFTYKNLWEWINERLEGPPDTPPEGPVQAVLDGISP